MFQYFCEHQFNLALVKHLVRLNKLNSINNTFLRHNLFKAKCVPLFIYLARTFLLFPPVLREEPSTTVIINKIIIKRVFKYLYIFTTVSPRYLFSYLSTNQSNIF